MKTIAWVLCFLFVFLISADESSGDVIAFDEITLSGCPVFIRALTKGRFFPAGGQRIFIQIGQAKPQQILTGGDGYGRLKITPKHPGFLKISVTYDQYTDTAKLLVMDPTAFALVVEMDAALRSGMFAPNARQGSQDSLRNLSASYRLIYLYGIEGLRRSRTWIESNQFPEGILLQNRKSDTLVDLQEKRVQMACFIGSADSALLAAPFVRHSMTFEESPEVISVATWEEIEALLNSNGVHK